ncbi:hypothetical protein BMS3Abin04_00779 [bacterium BMS3Abin04]|nr:hypothetical protein BMS3Abin04_00779 [bacterium BMS3Abin04]
MFLSFQGCQEATAPEISETFHPISSFQIKAKLTPKEKEEWTLTLKNIAKGLAILFKDESNRKLLETSIKTSDKKEQILEASEFLNKIKTIELKGLKKNISFREAITEVLPQNIKESINNKIKNLKFGLIDIYFPIKEWRSNWKSNNNLQVAAVGWNEQLKKKEVYAYTLDGNESLLPLNVKPNITTLVVYPSEKQGNYKPTKNNIYKMLSKSNSIASTNNESGGGSYLTYRVNKVRVNKSYDGWPGSTMEIYIRYRYKLKYSSGSWSDWHDTGTVDVDEGQTTDFYQVLIINSCYAKK